MRNPVDRPKRLRAQLTNPVTNKRFSVFADDPATLAFRVEAVRRVRDDLHHGVITPAEASRRLAVFNKGPLIVAVAFDRYMKTVKPDSRRQVKSNWERRLKPYFADLAPHELTREKMAAWQIELQRQRVAPLTIRNTYDHLAACMRMLVDSGDLDQLPWGELSRFRGGSGWRPDHAEPLRKRQAATQVDELLAVCAVARADDMQHWQKGKYSDRSIAILIMGLTGARQAEAAAMGWDCMQIDRAPFILRFEWQAKKEWPKRWPDGRPRDPRKNRKSLSQALHRNVVEVLRAQRAELVRRGWYRPNGPVFPGKGGLYRTTGWVIKPERLRAYVKAAGLPNPEHWVTHSLRHTFATLEVIASGGNLKATQARTGHADIRTLEGYLHAAGHLLGRSAIPEFDANLAPVVKELGPGSSLVAADPWGIDLVPAAPDVTLADLAAAERTQKQLREEKKAERLRLSRPFAEIAAEFFAGRLPADVSGRPSDVTKAAELGYTRAYMKAKRAGLPPEKRKKLGARGRIAVLAAWAKACKSYARTVRP